MSGQQGSRRNPSGRPTPAQDEILDMARSRGTFDLRVLREEANLRELSIPYEGALRRLAENQGVEVKGNKKWRSDLEKKLQSKPAESE